MEHRRASEEERLKQILDELLANVSGLTTSLNELNKIFQKITEQLTQNFTEQLEAEVLSVLRRCFNPISEIHPYQESLRLLRELGPIGFINRYVWRADAEKCRDHAARTPLERELEVLMARHPHVFMSQVGNILAQFTLIRSPSLSSPASPS
ncbi:hypothetical protein ACTOWA_01900 [Herbaspirillum seropedicae]|uniref:hypothetical protein n=1 Tax=Herbaspirillum seropedicae TaxID=964 RepID=UPI003F8D2F61